MEEESASSSGTGHVVVGVKSWVAYLGLLLLAALCFGVLLPLAFQVPDYGDIAAAIVMAISVAVVGYRFMALRNVQLYYDDIGVWVISGVLPWQKGVSGVKWRDMDEATFEPGFWSWISRSYTVRIGHRYTKASEIRLTHIGGGKNAAGTLNARHQAMIRAGDID
jgi:hypothetical protein